MASRKRNFVTQKVIPQSERVQQQRKIENEEVDALIIRSEAYSHFLAMIHQNQQSLISDYSKKYMEMYDHMNNLLNKCEDKVQQSLSVSEIQNSMFMLKIENQRLKCKEKLLQQKLQCHKVLNRKRRQENSQQQNEQRMKIQQIKLLKEQVIGLESIIQKKKKFGIYQKKSKKIAQFLPLIEKIILQQENTQKIETKLKELLKQIQTYS